MSLLRKAQIKQDICADCGSLDPQWASVNRGILLCDDCCSIHRSLGRQISIIKYLKSADWCLTQLQMVQELYTSGANSIWEHTLLDASGGLSGKQAKKKPSPKDALYPAKSEFIKAKHKLLAFVNKAAAKESENDLSEQLHSSARTPNLKASLRLLIAGANPNYVHNEKYSTPLHMAARAGQMSQVELLISYGADPLSIDPKGKTPIDYAREANFNNIADRLIECQYEITDKMTYFLSGRRPDHRNGQHFFIPDVHLQVANIDAAIKARSRLQTLAPKIFEEFCRDIYDEVDRREISEVWISLQTTLSSLADQRTIPFLPVNPNFSSIRNQGRQKLARFSLKEFTMIVLDTLGEVRRRQLGLPLIQSKAKSSIKSNIRDLLINDFSDNDSEPSYDSVPSEDDIL